MTKQIIKRFEELETDYNNITLEGIHKLVELGVANIPIDFSNAYDADLEEIGYNLNYDEHDPDLEVDRNTAKEALMKARPFPLTGIIKEDAINLIFYIAIIFRDNELTLDINKVSIESNNFTNEISILIKNSDFFFQTYLDYSEMAENGSTFIIGGCFASDEYGSLDTMIDDFNNQNQIREAVEEVKQHL